MDQNSKLQSPKPNPALKELDLLVGEWNMAGTHPDIPTPVSGHSTFEWLEHSSLLVWHFNWEQQLPPNAVSVIGHDDSAENYVMLYSDERGVARIYQISLKDHVWKMWRDSPGFSQRLTGIISDDGNTITSHGELSRDGSNWEGDLDVTYTKAR